MWPLILMSGRLFLKTGKGIAELRAHLASYSAA